jgi:hypothetical protein
MKYLYLISQEEKNGLDTFNAVVVCARNREEARRVHPFGKDAWGKSYAGWVGTPESVTVKLLGDARSNIPLGVVLGSYNAG